jgi:hypothetical protein
MTTAAPFFATRAAFQYAVLLSGSWSAELIDGGGGVGGEGVMTLVGGSGCLILSAKARKGWATGAEEHSASGVALDFNAKARRIAGVPGVILGVSDNFDRVHWLGLHPMHAPFARMG